MVRCKFVYSHSALQADGIALGIQCPDFPVYAYAGNTNEGFYNDDYYMEISMTAMATRLTGITTVTLAEGRGEDLVSNYYVL